MPTGPAGTCSYELYSDLAIGERQAAWLIRTTSTYVLAARVLRQVPQGVQIVAVVQCAGNGRDVTDPIGPCRTSSRIRSATSVGPTASGALHE